MSAHENGTALITGASRGVGRSFAVRLAEHNYSLALVARNAAELTELARTLETRTSGSVTTHARDLGKPDAARALKATAEIRGVEPNILINCIAFPQSPRITTATQQEIRQHLDLTVIAMTEFSHVFLPDLSANGHGLLVNVIESNPVTAVGIARAAYVEAFTNGLNEELGELAVRARTLSLPHDSDESDFTALVSEALDGYV